MTMGEIPYKVQASSVADLGTGSDVGKSLVTAGGLFACFVAQESMWRRLSRKKCR